MKSFIALLVILAAVSCFNIRNQIRDAKSLAGRLLSQKFPYHARRVERKRNDLLVDDSKSILDDKYAKKNYKIFNQDYRTPVATEEVYYDAGQPSLDKTLVSLNDVDGPIHVFDPKVVRDTQFDPLNGIPRPGSFEYDNPSKHFNDKDPLAYYDPVGDHKNMVRHSDDDSLIFSVPVNYQDTLNVDNTLKEIEQ